MRRSGVGTRRSEGAASSSFRAGQLEPVGEEPPAAALDRGVDEQPVLIDQPGLDQRVAQRDAAGDDDVLAPLLLQRADLLDGVTGEHGGVLPLGSVMVEETTYFWTRLR